MINLEFSPYTLSIFIIHFFFASVTLLYGLRFILLVKTESKKLTYNLIGMTFSSFILICCMAFGILENINTYYGLHAYLVSWAFGLGTYFFYLAVMKAFCGFSSKLYLTCQKIFMVCLSFYFLDLVYFAFTNETFLNVKNNGPRSLFFEEMNYLWSPNLFGMLLSSVCGICFMINAIYILKFIHKKGSSEALIMVGVILSIIGLFNDSILGSGLFYYGYPLSFLGCIFEMTRILNHLSAKYQIQLSQLKGEFGKLSRAAHLGLSHGRTMHDINNNLTNISFSARAIEKLYEKEQLTQEKVKKYASTIQSNVETIVNVSKKHKSLLHTEEEENLECNVKECFEKVLQDLELVLEQDKVSYSIDLKDNITIQADPIELYICITNMLNNSIDAIKKDVNPRIWINDLIDGDKYKIFIHDSGTGIPLEVRPKIFETQFTTKSQNEGTGLGLSTVRELILKNKGLVYLNNDLDNTCFVLEFNNQ